MAFKVVKESIDPGGKQVNQLSVAPPQGGWEDLAIYVSVRHKQGQLGNIRVDVLVRVCSAIIHVQRGIIPVRRQLGCQYVIGEGKLVIRRILNMSQCRVLVVPARSFRLMFSLELVPFAVGLWLFGRSGPVPFRMNVSTVLRLFDSLEPLSQPFIFLPKGVVGTRMAQPLFLPLQPIVFSQFAHQF